MVNCDLTRGFCRDRRRDFGSVDSWDCFQCVSLTGGSSLCLVTYSRKIGGRCDRARCLGASGLKRILLMTRRSWIVSMLAAAPIFAGLLMLSGCDSGPSAGVTDADRNPRNELNKAST